MVNFRVAAGTNPTYGRFNSHFRTRGTRSLSPGTCSLFCGRLQCSFQYSSSTLLQYEFLVLTSVLYFDARNMFFVAWSMFFVPRKQRTHVPCSRKLRAKFAKYGVKSEKHAVNSAVPLFLACFRRRKDEMLPLTALDAVMAVMMMVSNITPWQ
jgi:hypothetical protein